MRPLLVPLVAAGIIVACQPQRPPAEPEASASASAPDRGLGSHEPAAPASAPPESLEVGAQTLHEPVDIPRFDPVDPLGEVVARAPATREPDPEPRTVAPTRVDHEPRPPAAKRPSEEAKRQPVPAPHEPAVTAPIERFAGTFTYAGGSAQRTQARAAIDAALADLDPISRSLARRKLADKDPVVPTITIAMHGDEAEISRLDTSVRAPVDGPAVTVKRDGREAEVSLRLQAPTKLVETLKGPRGRTVNTFVLSEDGRRMTLTTQIEGERLSAPIRYRLSYRRR